MPNLIIGTGSYLPERVVTNHDIEAMQTDYIRKPRGPATLHELVVAKHGAISRRHVAPGESTSDMAIQAGRRALEDAGVAASELDLLVLGTFSGDQRIPPAVGMVQTALGCTAAKFLQVDAGCTGFLDGMLVADGLLQSGAYTNALVIGADVVSAWNDPRKFMPLTIFGDGAGAAVLRRSDAAGNHGIRAFATGSDGPLGYYVRIPGGGSKFPVSEQVVRDRTHYLQYEFPLIPPYGTERMTHAAREVVQRAGISLNEVDWVVPHQGSMNILHDVAQRLEVPFDQFVVTYEYTGNCSAASIPIALDQANRSGRFSAGEWLVMTSAGAGLAWSAMAYRWHDYRGERSAQ